MRKQVIGQESSADPKGLDLETMALVEITSEDPSHPIELALKGGGVGWRASLPGEQVIRLRFDEPVSLKSIDVVFDEPVSPRTQEFVLRWSQDGGRSYREIVRQQYTFSPPDTIRQAERYAVEIAGMTTLELRLVPDIGGGPALASLSRLRLA